MNKLIKLEIARIPAITTAVYVAIVLAIAGTILDHPLRPLHDNSLLHFLWTTALGVLMIGLASWIISSIIFAIYNLLSKRYGGIHVFVRMEHEAEQGVQGPRHKVLGPLAPDVRQHEEMNR